MKKNILVLFLLIASVCQAQYQPSIKEILEYELPKTWQDIEKIYIWEGEDFREFEVKKASVNKKACKNLGISEQKAPSRYFLFDIEGNKTPYFLSCYLYFIPTKDGQVNAVPIKGRDKLEQIKEGSDNIEDLSVFLIKLYEEEIDKDGSYQLKKLGDVSGMVDKPIFYYINPKETKKTMFGDMIIRKKYNLSYNKDRTSIFLHLTAED